MRKQDRLQKEALESCKFRGHKMTRFKKMGKPLSFSHSQCNKCGKNVYVHTNPPPNGIEISGEAVALGCDILTPLWRKKGDG